MSRITTIERVFCDQLVTFFTASSLSFSCSMAPLTFFPPEETGGGLFLISLSLFPFLKVTKLKGQLSLTTWADRRRCPPGALPRASCDIVPGQLCGGVHAGLSRLCWQPPPTQPVSHSYCPQLPLLHAVLQILSTESLLITVHAPCKATQERQGRPGEGRLAGVNVLEVALSYL